MSAFHTNFLPQSALVGEGARHGWRWAGLSCAKTTDDQETSAFNDDTWMTKAGADHLNIAVVDVATQKRDITGKEIQAEIEAAFASASPQASPVEILADAHGRLLQRLQPLGALGAACLMVVRLTPDGTCLWAHAGDAVLLHWRPPGVVYGSKCTILNNRHRQGNGLIHGVGIQRAEGVQFEEGALKLDHDERLLLMSDGVFHDAMTLAMIQRWIDAHAQVADLRLPADLVRKIEAEARLSQPRSDDSTLVVIERTVPAGRNHAA